MQDPFEAKIFGFATKIFASKGSCMSTFMSDVYSQAKKQKTTIVLPEGEDERTLVAAERILAEGIADLIIIGNQQAIASSGYDLSGATVIDNTTDPLRAELAEALFEIRKAKGMTAAAPALTRLRAA